MRRSRVGVTGALLVACAAAACGGSKAPSGPSERDVKGSWTGVVALGGGETGLLALQIDNDIGSSFTGHATWTRSSTGTLALPIYGQRTDSADLSMTFWINYPPSGPRDLVCDFVGPSATECRGRVVVSTTGGLDAPRSTYAVTITR